MRFQNQTKIPKYCLHARRTLSPGDKSADLPMLSAVLTEVLGNDQKLGLILSDKELSQLSQLLDRHAAACKFDIKEIQAAIDDPGGMKAKAAKEAAERSEKLKEYHEYVSANREFEKMVAGETSMEKINEVRNAGRFDIAAMNVTIGQKPKNLREAMALNAKLDIMRKMVNTNEKQSGTEDKRDSAGQ